MKFIIDNPHRLPVITLTVGGDYSAELYATYGDLKLIGWYFSRDKLDNVIDEAVSRTPDDVLEMITLELLLPEKQARKFRKKWRKAVEARRMPF
jgi:hypothetical protein